MPKLHITDPEFVARTSAEYRKDLRAYRHVIDVEYVVSEYERGALVDAEERDLAPGSDNLLAAAQLAGQMYGKTEEGKKEVFTELLAKLMAGETVFPGQPDALETFTEKHIHERAGWQANYLISLMKVAQTYSADPQERTSPYNGLGTGFVRENGVPDEIFTEAVRRANEKLSSLEGSNRVMSARVAAWESLGRTVPGQRPMTERQKGMYVLRGAKVLNELADKHFHRVKPSFFARFFRTKNARDYANERILLDRMANALKVLDPQGNMASQKDEDFASDLVYDSFKNKRAYLSETTAEAVNELLLGKSSPVTCTEEEYDRFAEYDAQERRIANRIAELSPERLSAAQNGFTVIDDSERARIEEEQIEEAVAGYVIVSREEVEIESDEPERENENSVSLEEEGPEKERVSLL